MGIVGISLRGTQKPAGKMKFTILFIGVMLLRGIELHRHMNRHGHKRQRTDPQRDMDDDVELNEIDELNEIAKSVDKQHTVDATEVQKDIRSNPGDAIENVFKTDGTNMAQDKPRDDKITPNLVLEKINWWQNMGQISDIWE